MYSKDMDLLWEEFFRDPSQFWDNRVNKRSPKSPDFTHRLTRKSLWVNGKQNPPWVPIKLQFKQSNRRGNVKEDRVSVLKIIKTCGKEKDLCKARRVHADIVKKNLVITNDTYVASALISAYAKCGDPSKARELFEQISVRDVVTWNALIGGYAQQGMGLEALQCFRQMKKEQISPDVITYTCILKACGVVRSLEMGEDISEEIVRLGFLQKDVLLGTTLVDMYAKCGALEKAEEVFEHLPARDIVSWNALLSGYVQHGFGDKALKSFRKMQDEGFVPNSVSYICSLKACGIIGSLEVGEVINAEIRKKGFLQKDIMLGATLVDMYAKCGALGKAQEVFNELRERNVVSWTALISGYVQQGHGHQALKCFAQMRSEGISPNEVTYSCILKACGLVGSLQIGEEIDSEVRKLGLLRKDIVLGASLVDMYVKCGMLEKARKVFEELPVSDSLSSNSLIDGYAKSGELESAREIFGRLQMKTLVSWNALITGYVQNGSGREALECFSQMQDEGIIPDAVTFTCILGACGIVGSLEVGEDVHAKIQKQGLLQNDIVLGTALVDMYAKCGKLEKAQEVFDDLQTRDVVSWNVLISGYAKYGALEKARELFDHLFEPDISSWNVLITGYAQHGLVDEVFKCFHQMKDEKVAPNALTYTTILKACSIVGSLEIGDDIYVEVRNQGLLEKDPVLGTTLVGMYAKCGALEKAQEVFEQLPVRNVVSWTSLLTGYAQLGQFQVVLDMFEKMRAEGTVPNLVTFCVLLTACSHAGLLEEGGKLFDDMCAGYGLVPTLDHYTCMIDLYCRAGHFDKAKALLEKLPSCDHLPIFFIILGACQKWVNVNLGRWAFEQLIRLDETNAASYVCMRNIYSAAGMQMEADEVDAWRMKNAARRASGCCWWTDISRNVHSFVEDDKSHPQSSYIYEKLKEINEKLVQDGYSGIISPVVQDENMEDVLCGHSEKIAIACALINTPEGTPICVTKNTHMCDHCHSTILLISMVEKRRIQVNDANCVHIFEGGRCICEKDH